MVSKILFYIAALWPGSNGDNLYFFPQPIFDSRVECVSYIFENYEELNEHVSSIYNSSEILRSKFYCMDDDTTENLIKPNEYKI